MLEGREQVRGAVWPHDRVETWGTTCWQVTWLWSFCFFFLIGWMKRVVRRHGNSVQFHRPLTGCVQFYHPVWLGGSHDNPPRTIPLIFLANAERHAIFNNAANTRGKAHRGNARQKTTNQNVNVTNYHMHLPRLPYSACGKSCQKIRAASRKVGNLHCGKCLSRHLIGCTRIFPPASCARTIFPTRMWPSRHLDTLATKLDPPFCTAWQSRQAAMLRRAPWLNAEQSETPFWAGSLTRLPVTFSSPQGTSENNGGHLT